MDGRPRNRRRIRSEVKDEKKKQQKIIAHRQGGRSVPAGIPQGRPAGQANRNTVIVWKNGRIQEIPGEQVELPAAPTNLRAARPK